MTRKWSSRKCNECNQTPRANADGVFVCGCGKAWIGELGVEAEEGEKAFLANNGFSKAVDVKGDVYYVGPLGHIIWLFADGTWHSDKAREGSTMEDYLSWLSAPIL